jgi:hypothetical protein
MRARLKTFFYFLLTIAAVFMLLKILNWLPMILQKETLRAYDSIEEVRSKLNMKNILVPSYFPEAITWPPARILAQAKPCPGVLMVFDQSGRQGSAALVISQSDSDSFPGSLSLPPFSAKIKVPYELIGRKAVLEAGACNGEEPCSRIAWTEGKLRVILIMKAPPVELIKIAESMLR